MIISNKSKKVLIFIVLAIMALAIIDIARHYLRNQYLEKAKSAIDSKQFEEAILDYDKASALTPEDSKINIKIGNVYSSLKDYKNTEHQYQIAYDKNNNDIENNERYIAVLLKNGELGKAVDKIILSNQNFNNNDRFSLLFAEVLADSGKIKEAQNKLTNINNNASDFYKSILYAITNDLDKSLNELNKTDVKNDNPFASALEKARNSSNASYNKLLIAQALNEIDKPYLAENILAELEKGSPGYRDYYVYLGYSYYLENRLNKAKEQLNKAAELDPVYGLTYYYNGLIFISENKYKNAYDSIKKAGDNGYSNNTVQKTLADLSKLI